MERKNIKCHFISNTHWDREWKFSAQRTRHMLVTAIDMLLDIFEKEPDYKHFHLDSQTLPIQDYLEINPEKKEILKKYISEGKLAVGPWFCLPDESTPISFRLEISFCTISFGSLNSGIPYIKTPPAVWNASNTVTS